jgi:alcohol dehydrogenase, propanol-preferring
VKALQIADPGGPPVLVDLPVPEPGPGQVRLRVVACGLCHSDLRGIRADPPLFPLPYVLGHEIVGVVDQRGPGVDGLLDGVAYAVFGPQGCGRCVVCAGGEENICEDQPLGPGMGADGGFAEYVLVSAARHLVPIGKLSPVVAAPLTDAGLSPYHAIRRSRHLLDPGSTTLIIGVGGLGHMAIQMLRSLTGTRILAIDVHSDKLDHARELGAADVFPARSVDVAAVRTAATRHGVDLVLDFVATSETLALGAGVLRKQGQLKALGGGGGSVSFSRLTIAHEAQLTSSYWGPRDELIEVLALANEGTVRPEVEEVTFDNLFEALDRLASGTVRGRLVLVPDGSRS